MEEIPLHEVELIEGDEDTGINLVSFVNSPAIEQDFVALSKEGEKIELNIDNDKQILTGPVLIPEKIILQKDSEGKPYNMVFKPEVIEKFHDKFMKLKLTDRTNHEHATSLEGNYMTESWLVADPEKDKAATLGLSVPRGTWMASFKVPSTEYWNKYVKTGEVKGFSVEGLIGLNKINNSKVDDKSILDQVKELISGKKEDPKETISQEELEAANKKADELQTKIDALTEEITALKTAKEEAEKATEEVEAAKVKLSKEKEDLEKKVTELSSAPAADPIEKEEGPKQKDPEKMSDFERLEAAGQWAYNQLTKK